MPVFMELADISQPGRNASFNIEPTDVALVIFI